MHGESTTVCDRLENAPVSNDIAIPAGWNLSFENGLEKIYWKEGYDGNPSQERTIVAPAPILIISRLVNIIFETEAVELAWFRDGRWKRHVVDRKIIATARTITDLADVGLPVTTINSNDLVKYLAEFESENIDRLERFTISNTFGWQNNHEGFLWGEEHLISNEISDAAKITFKAKDEGNQQLADALSTKGSYEKWIETVNRLFDYPKAIAGVYFSLSAPFLERIGGPNFVVDWSYGTSKGKTTVLRVAGSCWGNPDERSPSAFVNTWDNTKFWVESTATMLNGLPLILDDTKLAGTGSYKDKAAGVISHVIYLIANGRARGKGSLSGIRKRGAWRTIMLSSGEQSAAAFTQDGGLRARVISLWGPPFGATNNAPFVKEINLVVKQNYGHAGPRVVRFILDNKDNWDLWRNSYIQNQQDFGLKAGSNEVADRVSDYFAFLATVVPLIHCALPELRKVPAVETILSNLWNTTIKELDNADRPTAALHHLYNWAVVNQEKFWDKANANNTDIREPYSGWAGVWDKAGWDYIGFSSITVKKVLEDEGFDFDAVIRTWNDRGWLLTSNNNRTKQHRINGQQVRCYTITKGAITGVIGDELNQINNPPIIDFITKIEQKIRDRVPDNASIGILSILEREIDQVLDNTLRNPCEPSPSQKPFFDLPFLKDNPSTN